MLVLASSTILTHSSSSSPSGSRPQDLGQDLWLHEPHYRPHLDHRCLCCPLVRSHPRPRPDGHSLCQQWLPNRFLQLPSRLRRAPQPPGRLGDHWCALHHPALGRHHVWTYVGVFYRSTTLTSATTSAARVSLQPFSAPSYPTSCVRLVVVRMGAAPSKSSTILRNGSPSSADLSDGPASHLVSIAKSQSRQCAGPMASLSGSTRCRGRKSREGVWTDA